MVETKANAPFWQRITPGHGHLITMRLSKRISVHSRFWTISRKFQDEMIYSQINKERSFRKNLGSVNDDHLWNAKEWHGSLKQRVVKK